MKANQSWKAPGRLGNLVSSSLWAQTIKEETQLLVPLRGHISYINRYKSFLRQFLLLLLGVTSRSLLFHCVPVNNNTTRSRPTDELGDLPMS